MARRLYTVAAFVNRGAWPVLLPSLPLETLCGPPPFTQLQPVVNIGRGVEYIVTGLMHALVLQMGLIELCRTLHYFAFSTVG